MASQTLEGFRRKYPQYADLPDDEVTLKLGDRYPQYLQQDPDFRESYMRLHQARSPSLQPVEMKPQPAPQAEPPRGPRGDDLLPLTSNVPITPGMRLAAARQAEAQGGPAVLGAVDEVTATGKALGGPINELGRLVGQDAARVVDWAKPGASTDSAVGRGLVAAAESVPIVAASIAASRVGVPIGAATSIPAGLSALDKTGNLGAAAKAAAIGAAMPAADALGRTAAAEGISRILSDNTKVILSRVPGGQLAAEITQRFPSLSRPAVQKALEIGGGQLAANALLTASQAPEILNAPDPGAALLESAVGNIAMALTGVPELLARGPSQTSAVNARRAAAGEPMGTVEVRRTPPAEQNVTPPPAEPPTPPPAEPIAGPPGPPEPTPPPTSPAPPPAPRPPASPSQRPEWLPDLGPRVQFGRETTVAAANRERVPAAYAWAPMEDLQASHSGPTFNANPGYAPLRNTRDYAANEQERAKVFDAANRFDPGLYVNNAPTASVGPIMAAPSSDGMLRVLGGNGRRQALDFLTPDQWREFGEAQDRDAALYGLGPRPTDRHVLVRLLPAQDLATPEGVQAAHRLVDLLNPADSRAEDTRQLAINDASKVDVGELVEIDEAAPIGRQREWFNGLIARGTLDRNTRGRIADDAAELPTYVRRLRLQAAYKDPGLIDLAESVKVPETLRGLVESGASLALNLRASETPAANRVADAFAEMLRRVESYARQYPARKINGWLAQAAGQVEAIDTANEDEAAKVVRGLAAVIGDQVELLPINKRGERKIDFEETTRNWRDLFGRLTRTLRQQRLDGGQDLLGSGPRTELEVLRDVIRQLGGDSVANIMQDNAPGDLPAPDPRVSRLNRLERQRQKRPLTQAEEAERASLETALGQRFMSFWNDATARQAETDASAARAEMARGAAAPLDARGQGWNRELFGIGNQFELLEKRGAYRDARQLEFDTLFGTLTGVGADDAGGSGGSQPVPGRQRPGDESRRDGSDGRSARALLDARSGYRTVATRITDALLNRGAVSVIGLKAKTSADIAAIAQLLRDPRFETLHWYLIRDGKVVRTYSVSVRLPGSTVVFPNSDPTALAELAVANRADSIAFSHNHPSGQPDPSGTDILTTRRLFRSEWMPLSLRRLTFLGHIVTDHGRYSVIDADGAVTAGVLKDVVSMPDAWLKPPADAFEPGTPARTAAEQGVHSILGDEDVARYATAISRPDNVITVMLNDSRGKVRAIIQVPLTATAVQVEQAITNAGKDHGAVQAHAFVPGQIPDNLLLLRGRITSISGRSGLLASNGRAVLFSNDLTHTPATVLVQEDAPTRSSLYAVTGPGKAGRMPLRLGGMSHVRPVEMPELVRLAKELAGDVPAIRKMPRSLGVFQGSGPNVRIALDPRIFADPTAAAKTLAHEIGHLIDYLPDHTMRRGNLIGRLRTLRAFLKQRFGTLDAKVLRTELLDLTRWWKPYSPTDPPAYVRYRESGPELYADALSVLLNDPAELERRAPTFYREFWAAINAKPEVKNALFSLQDLLAKGRIELLDQRRADIDAMFSRGEEVMRRKAEEREARRNSWQGWRTELAQRLMDRNWPILTKAATLPGPASAKGDPRRILEETGLKDVTNMRFIRAVFDGVVKPIEEAGITLDDLGTYLLLRRVYLGDRAMIANPLGITPQVARQQMLKLRLDLGPERMTRLDAAVARFHGLIFPVVQRAVDVGAYNRQTFETTILPNRDLYAAFAVVDYLEDYVPAGIRQQIGTLKDIANPFLATVLKTVSLNNLIADQVAKRSTIGLLIHHFPSEIAPAELVGPPDARRPATKPGKGILTVLQDGKPTHYDVDPFVAEAFNRIPSTTLGPVVRFLDTSFRKIFYPLFISYNPAFLLAMSPIRDFQRTSRNLPLPFARLRLLKEYMAVFNEARRRFKGDSGALVREMEANFAIGTPFDTITDLNRDDGIGRLLQRYRLTGQPDQKGIFASPIFQPIRKALDWIEYSGMVMDSLPKLASYKALRKAGWQPAEAAMHVRNYAGLPNVHRKGTDIQLVRAVVPFWNVALQGWRSDLGLMTSPKTAGGWWLRWALSDGFLSALIGAASAGLLGAALKSLFDGVSEYDKTNYLVIPLGWMPGGDFGRKTGYLRMPRDETSRLLSGLTYKLASSLDPADKPGSLAGQLFDFGASQVPTFNPVLTVTEKWAEYAGGQNPIDPFRARPIIPRTEFIAGGMDSLAPMLSWTAAQSGALNFVRWDPQASTAAELTLSAIPGVNRLLKVSDYGYRERQTWVEGAEDAARAQHRLKLPDEVQSLLAEYGHLRQISPDRRTPAQVARYDELGVWYSGIYRPTDELITDREQAKDTAAAERARRQLGDDSQPFSRTK
jgi:hypothetical protein